jgi:hypothetical protein
MNQYQCVAAPFVCGGRSNCRAGSNPPGAWVAISNRRAAASVLCSIYEKIGKGKHSTVYKGRKKNTVPCDQDCGQEPEGQGAAGGEPTDARRHCSNAKLCAAPSPPPLCQGEVAGEGGRAVWWHSQASAWLASYTHTHKHTHTHTQTHVRGDVQVRTMHALDHSNILKFYAWWEAMRRCPSSCPLYLSACLCACLLFM